MMEKAGGISQFRESLRHGGGRRAGSAGCVLQAGACMAMAFEAALPRLMSGVQEHLYSTSLGRGLP